MSAPAPVLPDRLPDAVAGTDPRGWLTFGAALPDDMQRAEDSTADADRSRWLHGICEGWAAALWGTSDPVELVALRALAKRLVAAAGGHWRSFARPATPTEQTLLTALGYGPMPTGEPLVTVVSYPSAGVRSRRWPQLETV